MPKEVWAEVREAAGRSNQSVSAWITEAAKDRLRNEAGLALLEEYEAEHGPITDADRAELARRTIMVGYGQPPPEEQLRARGVKWEKK
jgi:hypothetical protein